MREKKGKAGRPPKEGEHFSERVIVMLSPRQRDLVQAASKKSRKYRGEWARMILVSEAKKVIKE